MTEENFSTLGKRIKAIRALTGLKREVFSQKHNINIHSLRSWELDIANISRRSLKSLLASFQKEGIGCSEEWILKGIGPKPFFRVNKTVDDQKETLSFDAHAETMHQEADFFLSVGCKRITMAVEDNDLFPYFEAGDSVGGVRVEPKELSNAFGKFCIVNSPVSHDKLLIRLVYPHDRSGFYNLLLPYPLAKEGEKNAFGIELTTCAPIVWHRKKL